MFTYYSENLLKWKQYLKILLKQSGWSETANLAVFLFSQNCVLNNSWLACEMRLRTLFNTVFYLLFGCCMANFGPLLMRKPH